MLEFGAFLRAVNDRPYEWMTVGCPEFDGDSHTRKADWFGMTVLFDALTSLAKFPICSFAEQNRDAQNRRKTSLSGCRYGEGGFIFS